MCVVAGCTHYGPCACGCLDELWEDLMRLTTTTTTTSNQSHDFAENLTTIITNCCRCLPTHLPPALLPGSRVDHYSVCVCVHNAEHLQKYCSITNFSSWGISCVHRMALSNSARIVSLNLSVVVL